MTRDTFDTIFRTVGKWGRRRCRHPFPLPGTPPCPFPRSSCPDLFHCCPVQFRPTGRTACVAEGFRWIGRLGPRISARRRLPHHVMPGLVPGIHVLRRRGAGPARARRRRDVDARNKSGHDGGGGDKEGGCGQAAIRVPIRRAGRKPACTDALRRVQPILTGQQWTCSGHHGRTEETLRVSRPPMWRTRSCMQPSSLPMQPSLGISGRVYADRNADRPAESTNAGIPARHPRDANVDPVAICLPDAYVDGGKRMESMSCTLSTNSSRTTAAVPTETDIL